MLKNCGKKICHEHSIPGLFYLAVYFCVEVSGAR